MKTHHRAFPLQVLEVRSVPHLGTRGIDSILSGWFAKLQHLGEDFLESLTAEPQLRVWHKTDRWGNTWWCAYDPLTGHSTQQASENDLRSWLEQRYYQ
ncbi:MAG: hypothetical protein F6K32_19600 [Desertifilum sp. SIO1I2]|nr:hypothetical protein [Desertifilum sp. SIO1I2]